MFAVARAFQLHASGPSEIKCLKGISEQRFKGLFQVESYVDGVWMPILPVVRCPEKKTPLNPD